MRLRRLEQALQRLGEDYRGNAAKMGTEETPAKAEIRGTAHGLMAAAQLLRQELEVGINCNNGQL